MGIIESKYKFEVFDIYIHGASVSLMVRPNKRTKKPYVVLHCMLYPRKKIYINENMYKKLEQIDYEVRSIDITEPVIRDILSPCINV